METEIWYVEIADTELGSRGHVYVAATSAAQAERKALQLAKRDRENYSKDTVVMSCAFHHYENKVSTN